MFGKMTVRGMMAAIVLLPMVAGDAWGRVQYTVTDLGNLGGASCVACGINNNGQVVGYGYTSSGGRDAFLCSGGSLTDLGSGFAYGINDSGQIVGSNGANQAFIYSSGSVQVIGPAGASGAALAINNNGQVVGEVQPSGSVAYAFLYSDGTMTNIGGTTTQSSQAYSINNIGQIVGVNNENQAFLYSGGSLQELGTLDGGGRWSNAYGINDSGQIVGDSSYWSVGHAYVDSNGIMRDLGTFGGSYSQATAINDSGEIVGWAYYSGNYSSAPFLITSGGMYNLNNLIPSNSGWYLEDAAGINNSGQICGWGVNSSGQDDAFLLTPTPEPSTLALLGSALLGIGVVWLRRRRAQ